MSVRGSKNKIILYIAGVCSILFVILLYQNASQRLDELGKLYERCHLNEESLSAQLQVNLEYKLRLEKSLQQEKNEHAQNKEELQNKLEEERQGRERENMEAVNKFTALQQQYKFLQGQHEDVNVEFDKLKKVQVSDAEEKTRLENLVQRLKDELKVAKESKSTDAEGLKARYEQLEKENALLKETKKQLLEELAKHGSQIKLPDKLPLNASFSKADASESYNNGILPQPEMGNGKVDAFGSGPKSSTAAKKVEQELFPSGNNAYVNTSTPMINPDAVNSQDKMLSAAPMAQPRQDALGPPDGGDKENVGAKPEEANPRAEEVPPQGVLRAPDIIKDFQHVPAIQEYKEKLRDGAAGGGGGGGLDRHNVGAEVGDEGEPLVRVMDRQQNGEPAWQEADGQDQPFARQPIVGNEIPKNGQYQFQADYDGRKEEGEDDDDVDPPEYNNDKNQPQQLQQQPLQLQQQQQQQDDAFNMGMHVKIPIEDTRDSVMIHPK